MTRSERRFSQGLAGFFFLIAAVISWWEVAAEGADITLISAICFTLAVVLILFGLIRKRKESEREEP
jgi:uncharacterized membrane protein